MQVPVPICLECKHFDEKRWSCGAFPNGIPDEIKIDGGKHDKPLEGQKNDIVFEELDK